MARLGSVKVEQVLVVEWHAKVTYLQREIAHLQTHYETMSEKQVVEALNDLRADAIALRDKLPPVQVELPFLERSK